MSLESAGTTKLERVLKFLQRTPGMKYDSAEIADGLNLAQDVITVYVLILYKRRRIRSDRTPGVRPYRALYWVGP